MADADARRRAEEALAAIDAAIGDADETTPEKVSLAALGPALCALIRATSALLAAGPEAPPPPSDAVREAAERLWYRLTPPANVTENGCVFVPAEDLETVLRALRATAGSAPGSEGMREAAEELQRIDSLLARRSTLDGLTRVQAIALALRVCVETDPKGEVAARYALRGGQKGGE